MSLLVNHILLQFRRLFRTLKNPPLTIEYPFVSRQLSNGARSQFRLDSQTCTACGDCEDECPVGALNVEKVNEGDVKQKLSSRKIRQIEVDYSRCISCGICVDICGPKALQYQKEFLPVGVFRKNLVEKLVKNKSLPNVERF